MFIDRKLTKNQESIVSESQQHWPLLSTFKRDSLIQDLTTNELAEILSLDCNHSPGVFQKPFPHVLLTQEFGQIIFSDANSGHLHNRISMSHVSLRFVFDTSYSSIINDSRFTIDTRFSILARKPNLTLKSKIVLHYDTVDRFLDKVSSLLSICHRLAALSHS